MTSVMVGIIYSFDICVFRGARSAKRNKCISLSRGSTTRCRPPELDSALYYLDVASPVAPQISHALRRPDCGTLPLAYLKSAPRVSLIGAFVLGLFGQMRWWPWAYFSMSIATAFLPDIAFLVVPAAALEDRNGVENFLVFNRLDVLGTLAGVARLIFAILPGIRVQSLAGLQCRSIYY